MIVADSCTDLTHVDLRGFAITDRSLSKLVRRNSQLGVLISAGRLYRRPAVAAESMHLHCGSSRWRTLPGTCKEWLPKGLEELDISGLKAPLELPRENLQSLWGLSLCGPGVRDITLAGLPAMAPGLKGLAIGDCSEVTCGLSHLASLVNLSKLMLLSGPSGVISDAWLDGLHGCSRLELLFLGDRQQPPETAITAAAVIRLVVACRSLTGLSLHSTTACCQAVLNALRQTDLGSDSNGCPRTIRPPCHQIGP